MKIRVLNALLDQNKVLPVLAKDVTEWPSQQELLDRIQITPEYRAVSDVGLPPQENLEETLNRLLGSSESKKTKVGLTFSVWC